MGEFNPNKKSSFNAAIFDIWRRYPANRGESAYHDRVYSDKAIASCVDRVRKIVIIVVSGKIGKPFFRLIWQLLTP
jgi:hypothetical protein